LAATPLPGQRDLDNYLFPLAVRRSKTTGTPVAESVIRAGRV